MPVAHTPQTCPLDIDRKYRLSVNKVAMVVERKAADKIVVFAAFVIASAFSLTVAGLKTEDGGW